mgnify:CR=1 FL=1
MITKHVSGMPVKIDWYGDGSLYHKGYVQRKLRKNFEVYIPKRFNPHWLYRAATASVPAERLTEIDYREIK